MKIEAAVVDDRLAVHVTLKNESNETLFLLNWTFDWYGLLGIHEMDAGKNRKTARPTRELAYACLGTHGELVLLNGWGPDIPPGISATAPRRPYATRLAVGETYRGSIRQSLPIHEWHAHEIPSPAPTQPVRTRSVRYQLEYFRESVCKPAVVEHVSFPGAFKAHGYPREHFEARAELVEPITVLQRTDAIDRFG
jgi:hypothetical protein